MKKIYGILMLAMLALCSTALVSCGDDEEEGSGSESALLGTWYTSYDTKYDGKCEETITFKSDHTFTWDYKYEYGGYDDGEPETGRWTLKDGMVGIFYSDGDAYYMFFDGKQLKCPDIDDWDNDVYKIYTKKKGSSGSDDGNTGGQSGTGKEKDTGKHDYVDLGLPSGTLWATCNIGASKPEEYGSYFAWGETVGYFGGKTTFNWSTYKWCNGSYGTQTKYNTSSSYGTVDNKTELELADDAAYVNWGKQWRMPSHEQFEELINSNYTNTTLTYWNGVVGLVITSKKNGNSIFLPAAGYRDGTSLDYADGLYWSRTLSTDDPDHAWCLGFGRSLFHTSIYDYDRYYGQSVRPVRNQ